jgi:hypothetical protein
MRSHGGMRYRSKYRRDRIGWLDRSMLEALEEIQSTQVLSRGVAAEQKCASARIEYLSLISLAAAVVNTHRSLNRSLRTLAGAPELRTSANPLSIFQL